MFYHDAVRVLASFPAFLVRAATLGVRMTIGAAPPLICNFVAIVAVVGVHCEENHLCSAWPHHRGAAERAAERELDIGDGGESGEMTW